MKNDTDERLEALEKILILQHRKSYLLTLFCINSTKVANFNFELV